MNVGSIPITAPASRVQEYYIQTYTNIVIDSSKAWHIFIGSFTTPPYTSSVMVNAWAKFHRPAGNDPFIVIQASEVSGNIATNRPPGVWQDGNPNTFACITDVPYSFYYPSVAASTAMNMYARVTTNVATPIYEWNLCLVRCIRT